MRIRPVRSQWENETLSGFVRTAVYPPKGDKKDGLLGFSRIYNILVDVVPTLDAQLRTISIGPYVTRFAFSKDAPPEHQLQVSWAGHGKDDGSVRLVLEESDLNFACVRSPGYYVVKVDKLHNFANNEYFGTCLVAVQDLRKKAKIQLTPEGRWGMAGKFLKSMDGFY